MKCPNCDNKGVEKSDAGIMTQCKNCGIIVVFEGDD